MSVIENLLKGASLNKPSNELGLIIGTYLFVDPFLKFLKLGVNDVDFLYDRLISNENAKLIISKEWVKRFERSFDYIALYFDKKGLLTSQEIKDYVFVSANLPALVSLRKQNLQDLKIDISEKEVSDLSLSALQELVNSTAVELTKSEIDDKLAELQVINNIIFVKNNIEGKCKSSGCFVVTATLDNPDHELLIISRNFRDQVLSNYPIGRSFIRFYYKHGPKLAGLIYEETLLRVISYTLLILIIYPPLKLWQLTSIRNRNN